VHAVDYGSRELHDWTTPSGSLFAVSIFASMFVTSPLESLCTLRPAWCRRGRIA
jgi:hypothetical protein